MPPITFITRHLAMATICPSIRWWAVTLLDLCTFMGNSLYIIDETSYYRCFANLPFSLCVVTAMGSYNPTKGSHLVLWECGLVIEFPPGSTILLASGVIAHSNVPVAPDETRYSVVQYSAGALFRWVENNFQRSIDYLASLSSDELEDVQTKDANRWAFGRSLLPIFK